MFAVPGVLTTCWVLAGTGKKAESFEKVGERNFWEDVERGRRDRKRNFVDWGLIIWGKDGKIVLL